MAARPYLLPVLTGTVRKGARSIAVARLVVDRLAAQPDVDTRMVELETLGIATDDEGTGIKDARFADLIDRADGLVIVAPEYNHGYPSSLKHALDTNYSEYVHKPVGLVGVSTGVLGGARMIENLLPVLRAVGLVPIQRDATVGNVADAFDQDGRLKDEGVLHRIDGMLTELRWMAATLRNGRESVALVPDASPGSISCTKCSSPVNHHADAISDGAAGTVMRIHACPLCGGSVVEPEPLVRGPAG
jgi:NAD(P)H-dependent FMN reductase